MNKTGHKEWGQGIEHGSREAVISKVLKIINLEKQRQRQAGRRNGFLDTPISALERVRIEVEKIKVENTKNQNENVLKQKKQQEADMARKIWKGFTGRFRVDYDGDGSSA